MLSIPKNQTRNEKSLRNFQIFEFLGSLTGYLVRGLWNGIAWPSFLNQIHNKSSSFSIVCETWEPHKLLETETNGIPRPKQIVSDSQTLGFHHRVRRRKAIGKSSIQSQSERVSNRHRQWGYRSRRTRDGESPMRSMMYSTWKICSLAQGDWE